MTRIAARVAWAAVLALSLAAGCTPSSPASPTPSPTPSLSERGPITFAAPGDPTGALEADLREWNTSRPDEPVTLRELPASADARRDDLLGRARSHDGEYTVTAVDLVWVPQLAETGALADLSADGLATAGLLPIARDAGTHGGVYTYPYTADAGLLYYRKDLLDAAGLQPPTTWTELASACATIRMTHPEMECFATPDRPGESLTVSVVEAIQGAGGQAFAADGSPTFDSADAAAGLSWLRADSVAGFDDGTLQAAFGRGEFVFTRGWSEAWALIGAEPGALVTRDRAGVAQLPGRDGAAPPVFGGRGLAISTHGGNLDTARDFVRWMAAEERQRRRFELAGSGPAIAALYDDASVSGSPLGAALEDAVGRARPRPAATEYAELSQAVSDDVAAWLADDSATDAPRLLDGLQRKLEGIVAGR